MRNVRTENQDGRESEVRRNVLVLAATMAMSWSVVQLVAALGAVTLKQLIDEPSLAGFAPGTFLASWAISSIAIGRVMDGRGRVTGLRLAFAIGILGAFTTFAGAAQEHVAVFLPGIALLGACCGGINLARAGAADMYPPVRRAQGISYVLIGAAAGAILSPLVYAPILRGARSEIVSVPWLAAAALLAIGALVTLAIRVDPVRLTLNLADAPGKSSTQAGHADERRPLGELVRTKEVGPALYAAVVAQAVMASFMTIIGISMVEHGHALIAVTVTMSVHFAGMFGLVLVVGRLVEWLGRRRAMASGLVVLAAGLLMLVASSALLTILPGMFTIGVGWNVAFVASTAVLSDAARPAERASLLGFNDFAAVGLAAFGVVSAGALLGSVGLPMLVLIGIAVVLTPLPALLIAGRTASAVAGATVGSWSHLAGDAEGIG